MIALYLPACETIHEAMDWIHSQGEVVRVALMRGEDGLIRGTALIRVRAAKGAGRT